MKFLSCFERRCPPKDDDQYCYQDHQQIVEVELKRRVKPLNANELIDQGHPLFLGKLLSSEARDEHDEVSNRFQYEVLQDFELAWADVERRAAFSRAQASQIQFDAADADDFSRAQLSPTCPPQDGFDAGQQFADVEGLRDVIVRAEL